MTQQLEEAVDLSKPERRIYEGGSYWRPEIQPQPEFGRALCEWMAAEKLSNKALAERVGCSDGTISSWRNGNVPSKDMRDALTAAGYPGQFHFLEWSQDMFVSSELVRMKNRNFNAASDHPSREFYEKYLIKCRMPVAVVKGTGKNRVVETGWEEKEFLFTTRVSDVVGCVVGDEEALKDWLAFQMGCELVGEPVLVGIHPTEGKVEVRGSYRKIEANKRVLTNYTMVLDQRRARIHDMAWYSTQEFLDFHREAWRNRWARRDEAAMFGTRAHKLGQAWIQFHALQIRDSQGIPLIDEILAPVHFWSENSTDETVVPIYLVNEPEPVQQAIKALQYFWVSNKLTLVSTEELVASLEHGVAGAIDCLCRDKAGNLILVDWKTSGGVYPKMFNQVSWYAILCHICRGEWPAAAHIVRLDKETAAVEVRCVYNNEKMRQKRVQNALTVLAAYRGNEDLESDLAAQEAEMRNKTNG